MANPAADTMIVSVTHGEIICRGTDIVLRAPRPVYPRSALGNVGLYQDQRPVRAPITLGENDTVLKISTRDLAPGRFILNVGKVLDLSGCLITEPTTIPVNIGELAGTVSSDFLIEHVVHLSISDTSVERLAPGTRARQGHKYVELVKAVHRKEGTPINIAFNERGERVDGREELARAHRARFAKFGKLHERLFYHIDGAVNDARVDVIVWPQIESDLTGYTKPVGEIKEPPQAERKHQQKLLQSRSVVIDILKNLGGADVRLSEINNTPAIYANLTVSQESVVLLQNSISIAHSSSAHAWENGPSDVINLDFAGRYLESPTDDPVVPWHSRFTSAIIKNTEPGQPHGHAPGCNLYSANSSSWGALEWATKLKECTVVSQSFGTKGKESWSTIDYDDIVADYYATTWPYPTIVQAAGNDGLSGGYVAHKGYNTITVGNHDDMAKFMASSSSFKNPTSPNSDRELPVIAANGEAVTTLGLSGSGTSASAPAVAGAVALIQSRNSQLKNCPEACRAILFAAASTNISGRTWFDDIVNKVDASDGSGALDAMEAVNIAGSRVPDPLTAPPNPSSRGWYSGTLSPSDFDDQTFLSTFRFKAMGYFFPEDRLRRAYTFKVALAWNSKMMQSGPLTLQLTSILTADLDLVVRESAGNQVAWSSSFDNNYEICSFSCKPGVTYDIYIRKSGGELPVWYGIAWNLTIVTFGRAPL